MHRRVSRWWVVAGLAVSGTYLFASGNLACGSFASEAAVSSADMCFIFDCTNGAFGGLLDPCATVSGTDTGSTETGQGGQFSGPFTGPFFADCPVEDGAGG